MKIFRRSDEPTDDSHNSSIFSVKLLQRPMKNAVAAKDEGVDQYAILNTAETADQPRRLNYNTASPKSRAQRRQQLR
ncbi:hypothetical protein TPS_08001 [Trichinella pseudospiralis]